MPHDDSMVTLDAEASRPFLDGMTFWPRPTVEQVRNLVLERVIYSTIGADDPPQIQKLVEGAFEPFAIAVEAGRLVELEARLLEDAVRASA